MTKNRTSLKAAFLYEIATRNNNSWGVESDSLISSIADEKRKVSVKNVVLHLIMDLNSLDYGVFIKKGLILDEGYGEMMSYLPRISGSVDLETYLYIYAGYRNTISNYDIRMVDDGLYYTAQELIGEKDHDKLGEIMRKCSSSQRPDFWSKLVKHVMKR